MDFTSLRCSVRASGVLYYGDVLEKMQFGER